MGSKKPKKQTVGYRYYISMHLGLCHGPIDALREIWFADKKAWTGDLRYYNNDNSKNDNEVPGTIANPNLFGGEDSEGGVSGAFGVGFGSQEQQMMHVQADGTYAKTGYSLSQEEIDLYTRYNMLDAILEAAPSLRRGWPDMAINYRGMAVINYYGMYIGTNAYLKDMSFTVERYWREWYPEVARIGNDANGIHIIYEALTNEDWGLGYNPATIDDASFRKAAKIIYDEKLGLSLLWDAEQELIDFIEDVKTCLDATFFLNRRTGLWTIKLIRPGEPSALTIHPGNATMDSLQRRALADTINEMSVKYTNPETEDYATLTVQDLANIQSQGRAVQQTKEYLGIRTAAAASRLAQRDLQAASATLATSECTVNRQAWHVNPGDVVTVNWPDEGIRSLAFRVVDTTQAEPGSDYIKLTLVEDVFGQANASFIDVPTPGYERPDTDPELFDPTRPWEFPFWFVWQFMDQPISYFPEGVAYSTVIASTDSKAVRQQNLYSYEKQTNGSSAWTQVALGNPTPSATLKNPESPNATSVLYLEDKVDGFADIEENSFVVIADDTHEEIVQVTKADWTNMQLTVSRGLMDTPPRAWDAGATLYFIGQQQLTADDTARARGQVVSYRPAMLASTGQMNLNQIPTETITLKGRFDLPYPVANVVIEGKWWPTAVDVADTVKVGFSPRNRLAQDGVQQVLWGAAGIAPEEGTSFGYELYDAKTGDMLSEESKIYQWNLTVDVMPIANKGPTVCKLVIFAEKGGRRNYADFEHTLTITSTVVIEDGGYGQAYGKSYGVA